MRRFLCKISVFSLLLFGYFVFELVSMPVDRNNHIYMLNVKDSLLQNVEGPRIVFLGGSSLAYGIQSPVIRDSLHVNVVNCGLSAGFGMKYILDEAMPFLRKGDVVVIILEYAHLYGVMYGSPATIAPAMYYTGFRNLGMLNRQQLINCFCGIPTAIRMNRENSKKKQFYSADMFNAEGDVVVRDSVKFIRHPEPYSEKPIVDEYVQCFISQLELMESKGCKVLVMSQPVCRQSYHPKVAAEVQEKLRQYGHPFAAVPSNHCMPDEYGYDTDHHMNAEGCKAFTQILISEIKQGLYQR